MVWDLPDSICGGTVASSVTCLPRHVSSIKKGCYMSERTEEMIKNISGHIHIGVETSFLIHTKVAVQILRLHLNWDGGSSWLVESSRCDRPICSSRTSSRGRAA